MLRSTRLGAFEAAPLLVAALLLAAACTPGPSSSPGATGPAGSARPASSGVSASPGASSAAGRLRLIVDTDMASDDVTAIASLVRDPGVDLLAITVVGTGEAHCPGGMFVARSVLTMLDVAPIPVACGRETPLGAAEPFPDAWRAGADVANGLRLAKPAFLTDDRPAEQVLVDIAAAEAGAGRTLTVLTLGTLTNLAGAAALDPAFAGRVRVVSMLGAVAVPGNVSPNGEPNPVAEWNAHADPTAVRRVLEAGFDLTLVPLDATNETPLTTELHAALGSDHAAGPADLVYELWSINSYMTAGGFFLWDPLASAVARDPSIVQARKATVRVVEGAGLDGGRIVEDPAGAVVTVATSADRARFEALLLRSLRNGTPRADAFNPVATISVTAGPGICSVDPLPSVPAGLVELRLTTAGAGPTSVLLFATHGVAWTELEAFAAKPDFEHPPAVEAIVAARLESQGTTSAWGVVHDGPLGLACAVGTFEAPSLLLRGPFAFGP